MLLVIFQVTAASNATIQRYKDAAEFKIKTCWFITIGDPEFLKAVKRLSIIDQEELLLQILESIRLSNLGGLINSIKPVKLWDEG